MAKFFLINVVLLGSTKLFPGEDIDDTIEDANKIRAAGGLLWPAEDPTIAAAAQIAQNARKYRGSNETELAHIMQAAVDAVQQANDDESVGSPADLATVATAGLPLGFEMFVATLKTPFTLSDAIPLEPGLILASDDPAKVWIRSMAPTPFTFQWEWYYDAVNGDDSLFDGASPTTPIKSLDEFSRRVRAFSSGSGGVRRVYNMNLLSDVDPGDTWTPSGVVDSSDVSPSRTGGTPFSVNMIGFRRTLATPGGSGVFTAAGQRSDPLTQRKAHFTDTAADFTGHVGRMVMVRDLGSGASSSGAAASIASVTAGLAVLTGGSGFSAGSVNRLLVISGSGTAANDGAFPITRFIDTTSVEYSNPNAVAPDGNNGAIVWEQVTAKFGHIINAPAFTTGGGVTVTDVKAGIATLVGAPASTFTSAAVGKRIRMSAGVGTGENDGDFTIVEFVSDTSVKIANPLAIVDATAQTFQGVIEVGSSWYDGGNFFESFSDPLIGSLYTVVELAQVPSRIYGAGLPAGMFLSFVNCDMTSDSGTASGLTVKCTMCILRGETFRANFTLENTQALIVASLCCWVPLSGSFDSFIMQENAYMRFFNCSLIDFNFVFREAGCLTLWVNSIIQGGYFGLNSNEGGPRPGGLGISVAGRKGAGVFNNIDGSATNPSGGVSSGAAFTLGRTTRISTAGLAFPFGPVRLWGVGALIGMHIKEHSTYMLGVSGQPYVTDVAGLAGHSVAELKIDSDAPIPVASTVTGVLTAVPVTSGVATTFVAAADGLVTITDAGAAFTAESVGRTVTIAGANTPANNGTYPIDSFIGATSVVIRNLAGVTDAVSAGTMTENPVVTRWAQLYAAPYNGTARNPANGTSIIRVAEG